MHDCGSLTRWNEVCHTASFAVQELLHAWQHGTINSEKVAVCRNVFNILVSDVIVRPSVVCLLSACGLWSVCLSVTFMHPTQAIEIFGNVSMPFGMLAICRPQVKFYGDRPRGTPLSWELNTSGG